MSSALLYAYLRSMAPPPNAFSPVYVPIINIPASDIPLRPEYTAVFRHANVDAKHLITLDDLPALSDIQAHLLPEKTRWVLMDHNQLQGQLGRVYSHRVAGVVDHHDDEGSVPHKTTDEPRIIEKAGSCTSLVVNYCRSAWEQLSSSAPGSGVVHVPGDRVAGDEACGQHWDAEVAKLGMASLLIDTANLLDENKCTEHDRMAAAYLDAKLQHCGQAAASFDRDAFYAEIDEAKKDIGAMGLQDILRKDYKQWDQQGHTKLGVSSVVKPLAFLQDKAGDEAPGTASDQALVDALARFAQVRALDMYSVMTTSTSEQGGFQRELVVWAFNAKAVAAAQAFATQSAEELGLEAWQGDSRVAEGEPGQGQWRRVWWQRQAQHSRKRVAPLLRAALGG